MIIRATIFLLVTVKICFYKLIEISLEWAAAIRCFLHISVELHHILHNIPSLHIHTEHKSFFFAKTNTAHVVENSTGCFPPEEDLAKQEEKRRQQRAKRFAT